MMIMMMMILDVHSGKTAQLVGQMRGVTTTARSARLRTGSTTLKRVDNPQESGRERRLGRTYVITSSESQERNSRESLQSGERFRALESLLRGRGTLYFSILLLVEES